MFPTTSWNTCASRMMIVPVHSSNCWTTKKKKKKKPNLRLIMESAVHGYQSSHLLSKATTGNSDKGRIQAENHGNGRQWTWQTIECFVPGASNDHFVSHMLDLLCVVNLQTITIRDERIKASITHVDRFILDRT
jgi:hypothetical protein